MWKGKLYVGIDPGAEGAIVAFDSIPKYKVQWLNVSPLVSMNNYDIRNKVEFLRDHAKTNELELHCCIEKVGGFIGSSEEGEGNRRNIASAHTMFNFGMSYGELLMSLVCARISYTEVLPKEWQSFVGVKPRKEGEKKPAFKNRIKKQAQRLFPGQKITLDTSDAFMIAYYCQERFK